MTAKTKRLGTGATVTEPKANSAHRGKKSISDYERGTWYAGLAMFGMFVFLIGWMWFTW